MASSYNSDDIYMVLADKINQTLALETIFASGGDLEIKTFEEELREDAGEYGENELPAIATACDLADRDEENIAQDVIYFTALVMCYTKGARLQNAKKEAKRIAANVERSMEQQSQSDKQLTTATADMDNAQAGSVTVERVSAAIAAGEIESSMRGVAALAFRIGIVFTVN